MSRPTRQTTAGRAYLDLQNRAWRERRPSEQLFVLYVLERWLARLAASAHRDAFILKGGVLLAALDARRPTADIDLLGRDITNDQDRIAEQVLDIARTALPEDDGVVYLYDTITAGTIREDAEYSGVRITMDCQIATARAKLRLDVNVGDPVTPAPSVVRLDSQRPGLPSVRLLGYPIETVLAEKLSTAIALGDTNTRVRDYADVYLLAGKHRLRRSAVRAALVATSDYRRTRIVPLSEVVGDLAVLRQRAYAGFRRRLEPESGLPLDFAEVVAGVVAFADPLVEGGEQVWEPGGRRWV